MPKGRQKRTLRSFALSLTFKHMMLWASIPTCEVLDSHVDRIVERC